MIIIIRVKLSLYQEVVIVIIQLFSNKPIDFKIRRHGPWSDGGRGDCAKLGMRDLQLKPSKSMRSPVGTSLERGQCVNFTKNTATEAFLYVMNLTS